jgi:hypothetical protein
VTTCSAPRKERCTVCALPTQQAALVNAAIWDGQVRRHGYSVDAHRVLMAQLGRKCKQSIIFQHADHIELTWHQTDREIPTERPVFPTDYESVTEKAAGLSARAMEALTRDLDSLAPKDLIAAAKLGLSARQHQETLRAKDRRQATTLDALFGLAAGLVGALPPGEVIDVTPIEVLHEELAAERKLLEAHSRG